MNKYNMLPNIQYNNLQFIDSMIYLGYQWWIIMITYYNPNVRISLFNVPNVRISLFNVPNVRISIFNGSKCVN